MSSLLDKEIWFRHIPDRSANINASLTIGGNICYLLGSALFLPALNLDLPATGLFVLGALLAWAGSVQDYHYASLAVANDASNSAPYSEPYVLFEGDALEPLNNNPMTSSWNDGLQTSEPPMVVHDMSKWFEMVFVQPAGVRRIIAGCLVAGNVLFLVGSLLFFPIYSANTNDVGIWFFIIGSFFYLVVVVWDLLWIHSHKHIHPQYYATYSALRWAQAVLYVVGALLFVVGSFLFFPSVGYTKTAVAIFIIGSMCFVGGSGVAAYKKLRLEGSYQPSQDNSRLMFGLGDGL